MNLNSCLDDDAEVIGVLYVLQPRYKNVKQINLEFAQDIEDNHLELLRDKVRN